MKLEQLSKDELLSRLLSHVGEGCVWQALLIAYLAEVEERRLHLEQACSSMFDFCTRILRMSEGEACRRIAAARLLQKFPRIYGWLERGDVHLSALLLVGDFLTEENHEELLREASGKTKLAVKELLAARFPRPDAPARMHERWHVDPLSPGRYRLELTVSGDAVRKLQRAQALMRHRNPSGDLAVILESGLDLLIAKLEKELLGRTARPKEGAADGADATKSSRHVPRHVRREVFARDGEQCTFVDERGRRCPSREFLELDHVRPKALGGTEDAANLQVRCRAHNRLSAERTFGREHVEDRIHRRQRRCGSPDPNAFETAARRLEQMGVREPDVRRALAIVRRKLDPKTASVGAILRAALAGSTE